MRETTSQEEIAAAQNGDEIALAAIITRSMPLIRYYARSAVRPGLDFDDAVQEGLIGLFSAINTYEGTREAAFSTYAGVCIHNAILSAKKAAGRQKHAPLNSSIPIPENQSIPGPEEDAIVNELVSQTLHRVETRLSPTEKAVLSLFLDGLSYEEIARTLDKGTKSVENALARARRKLK